jgi:hypothetical protein
MLCLEKQTQISYMAAQGETLLSAALATTENLTEYGEDFMEVPVMIGYMVAHVTTD